MAGYFELVGRIITEKGSWYKISFLVFMQAVLCVFQPQVLVAQWGFDPTNINVAGWLLYFLATLCAGGFVVQTFAHRMKKDNTVLPIFDIPAMIGHAFRMVPFTLVWTIYWALGGILIGLLFSLLGQTSSGIGALCFLLFLPFVLLLVLAYPVLMAAHTKEFRYKSFLNPFILFHVFSRSGFQMFVNALAYFVSILILFLMFYAFSMILGFSANFSGGVAGLFNSALPIIVGIILVCLIVGYLFQVFQLAYVARTCDIAKEQLEDSELLETEYYDLNEEESDSDDELYSGYQRKNTEDDDIRY